MKETRHLHFSCSFVILLCQLGFPLLNQAILVHSATFINCDQYKYSVRHQYQRNYCIHCKICPTQAESKLYNEDCKTKTPNGIPGQGRPWCTGTSDKSPWCPFLSVPHGKLGCTSGFGVYSTCTLQCDPGYTPVHSNWTKLECLESLHWDIPDQSLLSCHRTEKPDKPSVTSPGQRQEVKSGSDKTLVCNLVSELVGKRKIYWYFKDKQLYSDSDLNIYVIHGASHNNEGEYFCQVEDETGKSELSTGYFLKVESSNIDNSRQYSGIIVIGILVSSAVLVVLSVLCIRILGYHKQVVIFWQKITKCLHHKEDEMNNGCLGSGVTSASGSSSTSETTSTSQMETSDAESKESLISETELKIQEPKFNKENTQKSEMFGFGHKHHDDFSTNRETNCQEEHRLLNKEHKSKHKTTVVSSTDQEDLRSVLKNWQLMKYLRTLLDQMADANEEKPTYHSLGKYLGATLDEIANFEFICNQKSISPTETYLRKMTEAGQGLSSLLGFLKLYEQTRMFAEDMENNVYKHHV